MQFQRYIRRMSNRAGKPVFYARLRYKEDEWPKWKELLRTAESRSAAQSKLAKLEVELAEKGSTQLEAGKITFRQLAEYCKENKYTEAQYDENGTKTSGVRSVKAAHIAINHLVEFFGNRNIQKIQFDDLEKYKKHRLSKKKKNGKPIKLATAHRELSKARRMFNVAISKKWLYVNPFKNESNEKLIQIAAERPKTNVLSDAEEAKLLKAFETPERLHSLPIIIAALDTGQRHSSLVDFLVWEHVNFENEQIMVTTYKDVNIKQWWIPMTKRLKKELLQLKMKRGGFLKPEQRVFDGAARNLRKNWEFARKAAGVTHVRFHDLRHTTATRLIALGVPIEEVARILGHSDVKTTYRYVNLNQKTIDKVRNVLDTYNDAAAAAQAV